MNINFEKIRFKNIMSYGEAFTELEFSTGIDLVMGTNGMGKSTFNDALFYALFGKPFRKVKTGSLINRTNKKRMLVELTFKVDENKYKIIRGQKPNKFEIYLEVEDEFILIEQRAATKDYQKYLEEEILNLNETIFRQLIILGANLPSSKPFMELSQTEKESLFQVLTDTSIFGHLKTALKQRQQVKKQEIKDFEYKRDILKSSLDSEKLMIEQAEKQNEDFKAHHEENLNVTKENIKKSEETIVKYTEALQKLKDLKVKYDEEMLKLSDLEKRLSDKQENDKIALTLDRERSMELYNEDVFVAEGAYTAINYEAEDIIIQENKQTILGNTKSKMDLELKIKVIESAEKDAIDCTACNTTNYLIDISEDEVKCKVHYKEDIQVIMDSTNALQKEIKSLEIALRLKKKSDVEEYNAEKEKALREKEQRDKKILVESQEISGSYVELQSEITALYSLTDSYKEKLLNGKRLKDTLQENQSNLEYYNNKLTELLSIKMVKVNYDSLNAKTSDMTIITDNLALTVGLSDDLSYLETIIDGNNLKGAVIKKQIPFLNKGINHFLELFSMLDYSFVIDENFKERLINRDDDSEFNSLSNGQKARISFSIMFAFLKLIEERNGVKTNLLVLDEILDSSVDASGREELLNILKSEFSESKDIIIISHNPEIKEKIELFDRLIHINKDKFSDLRVEKL